MALSIIPRLLRFNSSVHKPCQNLSIKIHRHYFSQTPAACSFLRPPILGRKMIGITSLTYPTVTFLDSCKGLVCFGHPCITRDLVLWNPATNFWKPLPPSTTNFGAADRVSLGMGCNADGDDYSVVRIFGFGTRLAVEVYSSKSDCWKTMGDLGFKATVVSPKNHALVKGNPYWTAEFVDSSKTGDERFGLLGFNATKMAFEFVDLPKVDPEGVEQSFISWKNRLGLMVTVTSEDDWLESIDMWVYEEGERVWKRDAKFGPIPVQVDSCVDCSSNGKIGGVRKDGEVFIYDSKEGRLDVVTDVRKRIPAAFQMFPYDESVAYVQGMKPLAVEANAVDMQGFFVFSLPLLLLNWHYFVEALCSDLLQYFYSL